MKDRRIKRLKKRAKKATGKRKTRLTNKAKTITKRKVRSDKSKADIKKKGVYIGINF